MEEKVVKCVGTMVSWQGHVRVPVPGWLWCTTVMILHPKCHNIISPTLPSIVQPILVEVTVCNGRHFI